MLGQPASSHTVCRPPERTSPLSSEYCGPVWARVRIHSGLRSMGVALLRTSRRSSFRPSGAIVTGTRLRGCAERRTPGGNGERRRRRSWTAGGRCGDAGGRCCRAGWSRRSSPAGAAARSTVCSATGSAPSSAAATAAAAGARISSTLTCRPSSTASDVTPASVMPHGTMRSNQVRSGSQLSAKPCIVTPPCTRTPIAATLRSGPAVVRGQPDARAPVHRARPGRPMLGDHGDQRLLEAADVLDDVHRGRERHEGVADELAGTVPGDEAAAVDVDDRGAVGGPVRRAGPLARGVDGRVLEEHEHVRTGAVAPGGGVGPLGVPGGAVLDEAELFDVQRCGGCPAGPCAVVPHADHATPYRSAQHACRNADLAYRTQLACRNAASRTHAGASPR